MSRVKLDFLVITFDQVTAMGISRISSVMVKCSDKDGVGLLWGLGRDTKNVVTGTECIEM